MKIGFNGRFLLNPYTGIGQYSLNLLTEMARQDPQTEWIVAIPEPLPTKQKIEFPENIHLLVVLEKRFLSASFRQFWWEQVQCPRALQKQNPDLIHYPYPANPRFRAPWNLKKVKTMVTVHDLIPWKRSEYRRKFRSRFYQKNAQKALKN